MVGYPRPSIIAGVKFIIVASWHSWIGSVSRLRLRGQKSDHERKKANIISAKLWLPCRSATTRHQCLLIAVILRIWFMLAESMHQTGQIGFPLLTPLWTLGTCILNPFLLSFYISFKSMSPKRRIIIVVVARGGGSTAPVLGNWSVWEMALDKCEGLSARRARPVWTPWWAM